MRLVFMGTPAFAVPTLERLCASGHEVLAVYTQPDRPKGRGGALAQSPVKEAAVRLGLRVEQPERVRHPEVVAALAELGLDVIVIVGYGQIIPRTILDLPKHGIINVHASLLPKYRGAAPIQWAIANGETVTGVTTMRIDAGLDTGTMLLKRETAIREDENALELGARLSLFGADLSIETLASIESGTIRPESQNSSQASYAPILKKENGRIDWNLPAREIANRARGFLPWPGTYSTFRGQLLHVWKARAADRNFSGVAGELHADGKKLFAHCGNDSALELIEVQLEGRKRVTAEAFLNGHAVRRGEILGAEAA